MTEITRVFNLIENGDSTAANQLLPLVYNELRQLAASKMANERAGHSLQPTALVHAAYLRLIGSETPQHWNSRGHFFAAAAEAMRRILVENARKKQRQRYGGGRKKLNLDLVNVADPENFDFLDALDHALDNLAAINPDAAQVVKLRFFVGLTIQDTAKSLQLSVRTTNRHWAFAKAWIYRELSDEEFAT